MAVSVQGRSEARPSIRLFGKLLESWHPVRSARQDEAVSPNAHGTPANLLPAEPGNARAAEYGVYSEDRRLLDAHEFSKAEHDDQTRKRMEAAFGGLF